MLANLMHYGLLSSPLWMILGLTLMMGLTFFQRRKGLLGPITGVKVYFGGRLFPTDMAEFAVDSAQVIAVGDAIWLNTDDARSATQLADTGTLAGNQEGFHDVFAGFALEASAAGETANIAVATAGVMEMACASGTWEVGALVGMSENGAGDALLANTGISVATANLAVGRVAERVPVAATRVKVNFISTVLFGGPQTMM